MTDVLDKAIRAVRRLPREQQEEAARLILAYVGEDIEPYELSPEQNAAIDESLAQYARGEVATGEEVEAALRRFRL